MPKKKENPEVKMIPVGLPDCWIWKAFVCFDPEKTNELKVDVSGDDFSFSPEDAIRYAYQNLGDRLLGLMDMGVLHLFIGTEPVEVAPDERSMRDNKIILLAQRFNDSREMQKCLMGGTPGKDVAVTLALKKIPGMAENGLEVHMAEYDVHDLQVESQSKSLGPDNVAVTKFSATLADEHDEVSIFPKEIRFKSPFSKKDKPMGFEYPWLEALGFDKAKLDAIAAETVGELDLTPYMPDHVEDVNWEVPQRHIDPAEVMEEAGIAVEKS